MKKQKSTTCAACGMPIAYTEYHPACACVLFRSLLDAEVVRRNLMAVMLWWEENRGRFESVEQAFLYATSNKGRK